MLSRVFVSHSTKRGAQDPAELVAPAHRKLLEGLCDRLEKYEEGGEKLFQVVVDYEEIKVGQHWRDVLLANLGKCHAGIVLLNRKAITRSDWVYTEASFLRWQHWQGPEGFPLILVFLGKGSRKAFDSCRKWRPLAFKEVQFLDEGKEQTRASLSKAAFDELVAALPRTPPENAMAAMRSQLEDALREALIGEHKAKAAELSRGLMQRGPEGLIDLIKKHRPHMDKAKGREVVKIIAPWWVDPESAYPLMQAAGTEKALRAFSVTATDLKYTPEEYLRQAFRQPPGNWQVVSDITIGGVQRGAPFRKAIVKKVEEGLIKAYIAAWDMQPPPRTEINAYIESRNLLGLPTFVALPNSVAGNAEVTKAILVAFPRVTLLHLVSTPAAAKAIKPCHVLDPLPNLKSEQLAHAACKIARGSLS